MFDDRRGFVSRAFLRSHYEFDWRLYRQSDADATLLARLHAWADRPQRRETQDEAAFIQTLFVETWDYRAAGRHAGETHSMLPRLRIRGEGAGGGDGEADLALGHFGAGADGVPQVLCEFKDIRTNLDARQNRKGNNRSPVQQCLNYVRGARRDLVGNEPCLPW